MSPGLHIYLYKYKHLHSNLFSLFLTVPHRFNGFSPVQGFHNILVLLADPNQVSMNREALANRHLARMRGASAWFRKI